MIAKSLEELEEIIPKGDLCLTQFNTRITFASQKKFDAIQGILQLGNLGKLSKQAVLEYIINEQFAIINKSPASKTYAEELIKEHKAKQGYNK